MGEWSNVNPELAQKLPMNIEKSVYYDIKKSTNKYVTSKNYGNIS